MGKKHRWIFAKAALGLLCALGCFAGTAVSEGTGVKITELITDKAMYLPKETVQVTLMLESEAPFAGTVVGTAYHLADKLPQEVTVPCLEEKGITEITFAWQPPEDDFQGYLLEVQVLDETGAVLDMRQVAVDVSSTWAKFPRYGYVWDFTKNVDVEAKIEALSKYHLNGLQYYDWQYRHHLPYLKGADRWQDWSGRWIEGTVIRRYIAAAREKSMANMAYNMIYGANRTYLRDGSGVNPDWRLVKAGGEDFAISMSSNRGNTGILQFFNLLNEDWQKYIFRVENEALDAMGFDGWHGDTIGENGRMQTPFGEALGLDEDGEPVHYVKDGYTVFLNKAKQALGEKMLAFNPVGAQGIEKVNKSQVDVLYAEFWPWDKNRWGQQYTTYNALQREIYTSCEESGGKSLVVAAYVNYKAPGETFNPAAVLLLDAVVYASGGARIELGNGDNMLSNEYFPGDEKKGMDAGLQIKVRRMYDFIVAYENLLRDGQKPLSRSVVLGKGRHTTTGANNAVWTFALADDTHEVLHMINLTGTDNLWRDEKQEKAAPQPVEFIPVKYYTEKSVQQVFMASPDGEDLTPVTVPFEIGEDEGGRFIAFTVPSLIVWNMIFMR